VRERIVDQIAAYSSCTRFLINVEPRQRVDLNADAARSIARRAHRARSNELSETVSWQQRALADSPGRESP
jgi:hypothetical protein